MLFIYMSLLSVNFAITAKHERANILEHLFFLKTYKLQVKKSNKVYEKSFYRKIKFKNMNNKVKKAVILFFVVE